jgi:hypothetical protein
LPACDGAVGASGKAHHATIHSACTIIANNRKDGWLSACQSGIPRTYPDSQDLIPAGVYFFHVDSSELTFDPCPVVPNFRTWVFPHDDLPPLWHKAAVAQDAGASQPRAAIETCRLTNKRLACEDAQIIPAAEKSWFAENEMGRYCELGGRFGQDAADSPANLIRLRRDVQVLWDSLFFSIVPKQAQQDADGYDSDSGIKWWAHTTAEDRELYTNYHNRPSSHWLAELSNTCTRALHGISSRKSLDFFKASSQGDSLFDFPLARLRSGASLYTSASASLNVRDAKGAVLHQGNLSLTLTLRCRMSTRAVILTTR